ncbi:MAG TPA: FAD-dependent oxidoreductase, partial [Alphaproteobacteria bacterium]
AGAHWMHGGEANQFWEWAKPRYPDLKYSVDTVENIHAVTAEGIKGPEFREENFQVFADAWEKFSTENPDKDISLAELQNKYIGTENSKAFADFMAQCWMGATGPDKISCTDYFSDPNGPGGVQVKGGNQQIIDRMAKEALEAGVTIKTGVRITDVMQTKSGYQLSDSEGGQYSAAHVAMSVPLAVLKKGLINFDPPLSPDTQKQMDGIGSVPMTKVFLPVKEEFFTKNNIKKDTHIDIAINGQPPAFAHLYSNGTAGITFLMGGDLALRFEKAEMKNQIGALKELMKKIPQLNGVTDYSDGPMFVSDWNTNPLALGAYTAALPGNKRQGVMTENNTRFGGGGSSTLSFIGEGACYSTDGAGGMSSAHMSGKRAAQNIHAKMNPGPKPGPNLDNFYVLD